jgi:hypothetical protein
MSQIVKEISFVKATSNVSSDVYCSSCAYAGNILIHAPWLTYKNPNYDVIVKFHKQYMKYLDLCPDAIEYVLNNIGSLLCPKCGRNRLHVSYSSTYHPDWIRCSLNCHAKT